MVEKLPEIIARLLADRGITDEKSIADYFSPSLSNLSKPEELPGIAAAADAVLAAVQARRRIVVFGDYDCDGVCATAIAMKAIATLTDDPERVVPFLPDRLTEGYGMSDRSVARMLAENPDVGLVVTVDNGINSIEQVADLKAKGIATVVTDHHLPSPTLPEAEAIVDPKVAAPDHLANLCGAGVAFLLANRIMSEAKRRGLYAGENIGGPLLVLAGLATVTDIMPLVGQNRILVSEALRRFRCWAPIGLRELLDRASRSGVTQLTAKDFGFALGPRINAAGRMASGLESLELILSTDREVARELARIVDMHNVDRKAREQKMTEEALAKVVPGAAAQVIDLPDGHPGIAGIVAARVLERLGAEANGRKVPVCVIAGGHGSARAPEGLNIRDAMEACSDALDRFGGHAAAGGFSVKEGRTDDFRDLLCAYCAARPVPASAPDAAGVGGVVPHLWIEPQDLTLDLAEWLTRLEPFGEGNPEPVFGLRAQRLADVRQLGHDGRHLAISFGDRRCPRAVWWNHGERVEELRRNSSGLFDIAFTLGISEYGERHAELRLSALAPVVV